MFDRSVMLGSVQVWSVLLNNEKKKYLVLPKSIKVVSVNKYSWQSNWGCLYQQESTEKHSEIIFGTFRFRSWNVYVSMAVWGFFSPAHTDSLTYGCAQSSHVLCGMKMEQIQENSWHSWAEQQNCHQNLFILFKYFKQGLTIRLRNNNNNNPVVVR